MENRIGFGKRLGAAIIDGILITILTMLLGTVVMGIFGLGAGVAGQSGDAEAAAGLIMGMVGSLTIGLPVFATLYMLIEGVVGASPGKMILGIKIGNADGTPASVGTYLLRWVIKNISFVLGLIAAIASIGIIGTIGNILGLVILIGCFFVLASKRQAFHDMAAKTAIFNRADLAAAATN